jgi:hypothetical protein
MVDIPVFADQVEVGLQEVAAEGVAHTTAVMAIIILEETEPVVGEPVRTLAILIIGLRGQPPMGYKVTEAVVNATTAQMDQVAQCVLLEETTGKAPEDKDFLFIQCPLLDAIVLLGVGALVEDSPIILADLLPLVYLDKASQVDKDTEPLVEMGLRPPEETHYLEQMLWLIEEVEVEVEVDTFMIPTTEPEAGKVARV